MAKKEPSSSKTYFMSEEETLGPAELAALQRRKLAALLEQVVATNSFYRAKLSGLHFDPLRDPLEELPFTTRAELQRDQEASPPYGTDLTFPIEQYVRLHQTSGSSAASMIKPPSPPGRGVGGEGAPPAPLRWLDTPESWAWFKRCWGFIYHGAGVTRQDRIFFPFSFGPFIGFWAAFEAASDFGFFCLPAGGMSTKARLRHLLDHAVTVVCCTPTYALHMAEVSRESALDIAGSPVRALIVAGEPGGNIPSTRQKIEEAWNARVFDHTGMTEIGPCGFECVEGPGGVHLTESEFIPEVIEPSSGKPVPEGALGELVLTNLGRTACPLIRYRTGDQVRMKRGRCACGRWFARLEGGILGRTDDMVIVRGNNVFPSTIEGILRGIEGVAEFRIEIDRRAALTELKLIVEPAGGGRVDSLAARVADAFRDSLNFRPQVELVEPGSLPRFELKAKRVIEKN